MKTLSSIATGTVRFLFGILLVALLALMVVAELSLPRNYDQIGPFSFEGSVGEGPRLLLINERTANREGRRLVALQNDWTYIFPVETADNNHSAYPVRVSRYFLSDFASIPFPFNRLINPFGRHAEAAILHDWLYALGGPVPRHEADLLFYRAMHQADVNWFRRRLMYGAVRIGGWAAFGRNDEWNTAFYIPETELLVGNTCRINQPNDIPPPLLFLFSEGETLYEYSKMSSIERRDTVVVGVEKHHDKLELELSNGLRQLYVERVKGHREYSKNLRRYFTLNRSVFGAAWGEKVASEACSEKIFRSFLSSRGVPFIQESDTFDSEGKYNHDITQAILHFAMLQRGGGKHQIEGSLISEFCRRENYAFQFDQVMMPLNIMDGSLSQIGYDFPESCESR